MSKLLGDKIQIVVTDDKGGYLASVAAKLVEDALKKGKHILGAVWRL